jgi:hypothetical protein
MQVPAALPTRVRVGHVMQDREGLVIGGLAAWLRIDLKFVISWPRPPPEYD